MVLFYVEIEDKLRNLVGNSIGVVKACAEILLRELKYRFIISNDMLVAAFCDPWSQHIPHLNEILTQRGATKIQILTDYCYEHEIETNISPNGSCGHENTSTPTNSNRLLFNLFKKHTININENNTLEKELNDFEKIHMEYNENSCVLKFWRENEKKFVIMAKIANIVLSKMTSSSESESGFSTAGCVVNQKRSSLHPLKVEKILFIHHNTWLLEGQDS